MDKTGCGTQNGIAAAGKPMTLFYLIQFTWGLTVNLVGLLVFLCCRTRFPSKKLRNSIVTCLPGNCGSLSLGIFIFLSVSSAAENSNICAHEYGHTIQCPFLGPLYWFVVAIPSVIWCNLFSGYRKKHHIPYDFLYCERWATAWGKRAEKGQDLLDISEKMGYHVSVCRLVCSCFRGKPSLPPVWPEAIRP